MALWRLYYHLVWATKHRHPLIEPQHEPGLYNYIIGKADSLGAITHAIGGIEDHLHVVVSIPPKLSIADFVKNIKGSSAYYMNHLNGGLKKFGWQDGYGVFSMGETQLETAVAYVQKQKEHHAQGTEKAWLEKMTNIDDRPQLHGFKAH